MASPAETMNNVQIGWKKLDLNQKMVIVITVIIFLVAASSLAYWVSRPSYSVLFSNLSSNDASAIVAKLQEKKIPYNLIGMQTIEVSSDKVYQTRIELAGEGLPQGGTVGFEIFDQSSFGLSEFTQKINYRRALEGELGRTIQQLNEVEGARVHIVMPEPSLYQEKENPATASIVIKPRAGSRLLEGQVQGVMNLVARSVEGLKPENITIVDTSGNVLSGSNSDPSFASNGYTKVQTNLKETYENNLEQKIQTMLGKVLGNVNNAVVRVSADLDFTQKEIRRDIVEQPDRPVVVSEQSEKEKYEGEGSSMPASIAGTTTQASGSTTGSGSTTTYPQTTQGSGNSGYTRTNKTTNYDSTKISEHEIKAPGEVKKLSIAVIVNNDGTKPMQNKTIENLVSAAAGLDKTRGDVLTVNSVPFDTKWMKEEEKAIAETQKKQMYTDYGKYAVIAVLLLVAIFALFKIVSSIKPATPARSSRGDFVGGSQSRGSLRVASPGINISDEDLGDLSLSNLTPEQRKELAIKQRKSQLTREEIQNLAKERPGDIAQLLRIWLNT